MDVDVVVEALARHHLASCLASAAHLGPSRSDFFAHAPPLKRRAPNGSSKPRGVGSDAEDVGAAKERVARTCTASYHLEKCRAVAHAFLEGTIVSSNSIKNKTADGDTTQWTHSAGRLRGADAERLYTQKAQRLAEDEVLPPVEKLALVRDDAARLLRAPTGSVNWGAMLPVAALHASLARLVDGDWSVEVARCEFKLALVHLARGCIDAAAEHVSACRSVLKELRADTGDLPAELDLVDAACYMLRAVPSAGKALRRAENAVAKLRRALGTSPADEDTNTRFFPYHMVAACAALELGADHHDALQRVERAIATSFCARQTFFVSLIQLSIHFKLLARADAELGAAPVAAARERLLEEIRVARTQAELDEINSRLRYDVAALEEKRRSHEALCVRQVDRIVEALRPALRPVFVTAAGSSVAAAAAAAASVVDNRTVGRDSAHGEECEDIGRLAAVLAFAGARACWSVARRREARWLMRFASTALAAALGSVNSAALGLLLLDRGMLEIGSPMQRSELTPTEQRLLCAFALEHASAPRVAHHIGERGSSGSSAPPVADADEQRGLAALRRFCGSRSRGGDAASSTDDSEDASDDSESDSDEAHRALERGINDAEAALGVLQQHRGWYCSTIGGALMTLENGYHAAHRVKDELTTSALLCDMTATLLGPTHPRTLRLLKEYQQKLRRVHPPLISPSWGVHELLTRITLSSNTPGAVIYFTMNGEAPTEEEGVNGTVRYAGPIVLDRLGRIMLRAFATFDGARSGEVSAKFSVVRK